MIDSGCTFNFFTPVFSVFYVGKETGQGVIVELGGKDKVVHGKPMRIVEIPVLDIAGHVQLFREACSISDECRYPLLGCMMLNKRCRGLLLGSSCQEKVKVQGKHGEFWALVARTETGAPYMVIAPEGRRKMLEHRGKQAYTADISIGEAIQGGTTEEARMKELQRWHRKYGHARGRRLYLTLKEAGVKEDYTEKECGKVACRTCELLNRKYSSIPRLKDPSRQNMQTGEEAFQDLTDMPKAFDGSHYLSVIVDAHSRLTSLMSIRHKDRAVVHGVKHIRNMESLGHKVKKWSSDNGGEFINEDYRQLLTKEGIDQNPGCPYTPQSQGMVERMNQTVKSLIGKVLRETALPVSIWPALLPGIAQQINSCVNSTTGESPYKRSGHPRGGKMIGLTAGEVVSIVEPRSRVAYEGWFGGYASDKVANVVCKVGARHWRVLRVHPSIVKCLPCRPAPYEGGNPLKAELRATDIESVEAENYDALNGNEEASDEVIDEEIIDNCRSEPNKRQHSEEALHQPHATAGTKRASGGPIMLESIEEGEQITQLEFKPQTTSHEDELGGANTEDAVEYLVRIDIDETDEDNSPREGAMVAGVPLPPQNKSKNQIPASREDVLRGSHAQADMKELQSFFDNNALGGRVLEVNKDIIKKTMTAGWRRTWKGEGENRKAKSRLYVRGFQDKRERGWVETYSSTVDRGQLRIAMMYALHRGWNVAKADVSTAFLQAPAEDELYLRMPNDLPAEAKKLGYEPGGLYRQLKAIYGRADAPRLYTEEFKGRSSRALKWMEVAPAILLREENGEKKAVMAMHVDDLKCASVEPVKELEAVRDLFKLGEISGTKSREGMVYTGLNFKWGTESFEYSQKDYVEALEVGLEERDSLKKRKFSKEDVKMSEVEEVNVAYQEAQQKWCGVLGWIANTQPRLSTIFSEASRNNTRPSAASVLGLRRACQYAKEIHTPLVFKKVDMPVVVMWCDGHFDLSSCTARIGWEAQVLDKKEMNKLGKPRDLHCYNVIGWRSKRSGKKMSSASESELEALLEGVKQIPLYTSLITKLWGVKPKVYFVTDSQIVLRYLRTGQAKTDHGCQGRIELVRQRLEELGAVVLWEASEHQRADKHTKVTL